MIKASELKEGDEVVVFGVVMTVITNHIGDVLSLADEESDEYRGVNLFYDDEFDVADSRSMGIDLT